MIRYPDDKRLYPKIYQRKVKQWPKGFLFAWTYCFFHITYSILPYVYFWYCLLLLLFSFAICYFRDVYIEWQCTWLCVKAPKARWIGISCLICFLQLPKIFLASIFTYKLAQGNLLKDWPSLDYSKWEDRSYCYHVVLKITNAISESS